MIGRHILQGSLFDFIDQSVPYMFQLSPEHQTAQPHQVAILSLNVGTSLRRKTNISSQRPLMFTHVQPQSQYSTKSAAAAAATAVEEEEDSEDSEEIDDNAPKKEGTKYNLHNIYAQVNMMSKFSTTSAAAIVQEEDSVDSEEDADDKPTEGMIIGSAIFAQENGTKTLSATKTEHSETEENLAYSNSDTEGSSETCESETKFGVDAVASSTRNRRRKSNEALTRKSKALRNNYWIKNEQKRKSNKNYKTALLALNDSDLTSMPTGTDHQVR
jgi:hypothetical protein